MKVRSLFLRYLILSAILVLTICWLLHGGRRILIFDIFAVPFAAAIYWTISEKVGPILIGWLVLISPSFTPYDFSFETRPGLPHFLPILYGLPTGIGAAKADRGEVILGGCVTTDFDAKYMFVW